jgi:hypothetical protein
MAAAAAEEMDNGVFGDEGRPRSGKQGFGAGKDVDVEMLDFDTMKLELMEPIEGGEEGNVRNQARILEALRLVSGKKTKTCLYTKQILFGQSVYSN